VAASPWPLLGVDAARETSWPGGDQILAYHAPSRQLFVAVHRHAREGSHKVPADEIWQVDVPSHRVVNRISGDQALSLAVTPGAHPLLFAINAEDGSLSRYDVDHGLARTGKSAAQLAETATTLFTGP
jgi:methylamine dehydrogenase heavy chain